jgi:signal peptidase II
MDDTTPVRRLPLALGIAATVVVLDQVTKLWAERTLPGRAPIPVLGEFLQFQLHYNPGAAFSIGTGMTWIFTIAAAAAAGGLLWYLTRPHSRARTVGLALTLGGATTHLGDRLFRAPGFARGQRGRLHRLQRVVHRERRGHRVGLRCCLARGAQLQEA